MIYIMINEAARILEEGVVGGPEDVDVGMIMGTGFPAFTGGLLRYADTIGTVEIIGKLAEFAKKFKAERLSPCSYLTERQGVTFF